MPASAELRHTRVLKALKLLGWSSDWRIQFARLHYKLHALLSPSPAYVLRTLFLLQRNVGVHRKFYGWMHVSQQQQKHQLKGWTPNKYELKALVSENLFPFVDVSLQFDQVSSIVLREMRLHLEVAIIISSHASLSYSYNEFNALISPAFGLDQITRYYCYSGSNTGLVSLGVYETNDTSTAVMQFPIKGFTCSIGNTI